MKRYHEEKKIIENRSKLRQHLDASMWAFLPADKIQSGRFRKTLRCGGCGRARCQVCHPEKFPKRQPTRKEQIAYYAFREYEDELNNTEENNG